MVLFSLASSDNFAFNKKTENDTGVPINKDETEEKVEEKNDDQTQIEENAVYNTMHDSNGSHVYIKNDYKPFDWNGEWYYGTNTVYWDIISKFSFS